MTKKTLIILSCLIAAFALMIGVSVHFLYAGPSDGERVTVVEETDDTSLNLPDEAVDAPVIVPEGDVNNGKVARSGEAKGNKKDNKEAVNADKAAGVAKSGNSEGNDQRSAKTDSSEGNDRRSAKTDSSNGNDRRSAQSDSSEGKKTNAKAGDAQVTSQKAQAAQKPAELATPKGAQTFSVKNCATLKQNTLRQNADNSLELLDENGKTLWKKPFPGKICGSVAQVDHLGNGKIQFLMAEGQRLHLIDRLGREVSGFPMKLPAKALKGPYAAKAKGQNCWKVVTASGTVYYDKKVTSVVATAAK